MHTSLLMPALQAYRIDDPAGQPAEGVTVRRARIAWMFRRITPYLGAAGAPLLTGMVLVTMYFTWLDWQWIAFLGGILGAAIVALASRSARAEWLIARRTAQLSLARQKLAREAALRTRIEQDLAVFLLATDITGPADVALPAHPLPRIELPAVESPPPTTIAGAEGVAEQDDDAMRLRNALAGNDFCLFFQTIEPVCAPGVAMPFREILLRLKAEEENMMPPGSFLPVAEKYGMLPELDRWVIGHLLVWLHADVLRQQAVYSINISAKTLVDLEFPAFVKKALRASRLPGSLLCFELQETDVLNRSADATRFIRQLRPEGCRFAISGFCGNRVSFDLLRQVPVDFLEIDGSLILNMRRSAVDLARVKAIHRVAQAIGIGTIAECVEDKKTLARLRSIGVDFAQGFVISRPRDLRQISMGPAADPGNDTAGRHNTTAMAA